MAIGCRTSPLRDILCAHVCNALQMIPSAEMILNMKITTSTSLTRTLRCATQFMATLHAAFVSGAHARALQKRGCSEALRCATQRRHHDARVTWRSCTGNSHNSAVARDASPIATSGSSNSSNARSNLAAIKAALPISVVAEALFGAAANLTGTPGRQRMLCPFHDDSNPSLSLSDDLGVYHCFACGAKGDLFHLARAGLGLSTDPPAPLPTVIAALAARFPSIAAFTSSSSSSHRAKSASASQSSGTSAHQASLSPPLASPPPMPTWGATLRRKRAAAHALRLAVEYYAEELMRSAEARRYLVKNRALSVDTMRLFRMGYAPDDKSWSACIDALCAQGVQPETCLECGIASKSERSASLYDVFRARVIVPICDVNGTPIALAGRLLKHSERAPKYLNSKESSLFKKTHVLFGAHIAKKAPAAQGENGVVLVVEGYMDVLALHDFSQGYIAAVATMGTAVSEKQVRYALSLREDDIDGKVVFNFDNDAAGFAAAERLCDSVLLDIPESVFVYIAFPPDDVKDPDEFLRSKKGSAKDYMHHITTHALPWAEWRGKRIVQQELKRMDELYPRRHTDGLEDLEQLFSDAGMDVPEELKNAANRALEVAPLPEDLSSTNETLFTYQLAEQLREQQLELLTAFGARPSQTAAARKQAARRKEPVRVRCSAATLDRLGLFIATAKRALPGLDASRLIHLWSEALSDCETAAIPVLFAAIANRAEMHNKDWTPGSPLAHARWEPPAPWVLEELSPRALQRLEEGSRAEREMSEKRIRFQEKYVEPYVAARRCPAAQRLATHPRRAAEDRILRTLVWASEPDRLDGLDKLLSVMVTSEEVGLSFWTHPARQELFNELAEIQGSPSAEEIAAMLEDKPWWCPEINELFLPDDESDTEWAAIRAFEKSDVARTVESSALAVKEMESMIASHVAIEDTSASIKGALNARKAGDYDLMDQFVARQISLKSAVDRTKFRSKEQIEEALEEEKERREEEENKSKLEDIMKKLEQQENIPYPAHVKKAMEKFETEKYYPM